MWASNVLTVEVVYKILYEPFQLSLCYQVHIFHSHIIMWVLSFCQIDIFTITLNIFPFILFSSNLCQSPSRQTVSNSFAKSTNTRYNFFFLFYHRFCSLIVYMYVTLSKFKGDLALATEGHRCITYFNNKQIFLLNLWVNMREKN